ncbi:triose-phosphate isomerase [Candidatus Falkowbacteria bacterium CG_4_9_14_3_um_filter_36_9]|uniref:Triosephosphate isomerase n=1 Tax=Candidatus Falkowbacteria bacterium CG02_land_8_20_14_3_00_36_14 TaxID=1974560 RepID=A0A2M7DMI5_9BACT|nr:MAG: triose-phosphate isomerase [Candidatus Falkowbacteria bacterium CG02_land_8_20_14_3_00_36_14]PIX10787.1 MAG: triose-phosphate isomerase [Candidatus Falkowbacteria bacterium CG_4_8_14_3_um_filter_36_11]PJA11082.1 MAG: triose-phosphate isomerase [Candidatus Falkowbacteria bacterium CG_4_10_14_0_2_um_filter_36_22]PJB19646.1 MAG: triose-phosphate isomerase [Candidatus Falkowbacteria bacterium CG_4_9_14_3_um_filter_36_9]
MKNKIINNKIVVANWKMRLSLKESLILAKKMKNKFKNFKSGEVVICPNFLSLCHTKNIMENSSINLGSQNVFWEEKGSYTGEVSPGMLVEAGCEYAIIGHSERRKYILENYEMIHQKLKAVLNNGKLVPIVCIGENTEERKTDQRDFILTDQLYQALSGINIVGEQQIIIAYEPIWAIGSGITIEPAEAKYAHKIIKLTLNDIFGMQVVKDNFRIIYGGSINSRNVKGFVNIEDIDGLLVGGASLDEDEFYKVAKAILK